MLLLLVSVLLQLHAFTARAARSSCGITSCKKSRKSACSQRTPNHSKLFLDQLLFFFCLFVFFLSFFLSCLSLSQLERSPRFGSERGETLEGMVICRTAFRFSTPYHQRDCVNKDKTQNKRGGKKEMRQTWCTTLPFPGHCLMKLMRRVVLLLY